MSNIAIELLHNLTKTYDYFGGEYNQYINLTEESIYELVELMPVDSISFPNKSLMPLLIIDGYSVFIVVQDNSFDREGFVKRMEATGHRKYPEMSYEELQQMHKTKVVPGRIVSIQPPMSHDDDEVHREIKY